MRTSTAVELESADDWMDELLRNYRRWHFSGEPVIPQMPPHCASAEHLYQGRYVDDDGVEHYDEAIAPVDERAGDFVDQVVRAMPTHLRDVLRMHYVLWPTWRLSLKWIYDGKSGFSVRVGDEWRAKQSRLGVDAYLDRLLAAREHLAKAVHESIAFSRYG